MHNLIIHAVSDFVTNSTVDEKANTGSTGVGLTVSKVKTKMMVVEIERASISQESVMGAPKGN